MCGWCAVRTTTLKPSVGLIPIMRYKKIAVFFALPISSNVHYLAYNREPATHKVFPSFAGNLYHLGSDLKKPKFYCNTKKVFFETLLIFFMLVVLCVDGWFKNMFSKIVDIDEQKNFQNQTGREKNEIGFECFF